MSDRGSRPVFWALLGAGTALVAVGPGLITMNVVAALNDRAFTASLGGLVLGLGGALLLLAALCARRERARPLGGVIAFLGALAVGWGLGGGLDELLLDRSGGVVLAVVVVLVGAGLACGGWMVACRED